MSLRLEENVVNEEEGGKDLEWRLDPATAAREQLDERVRDEAEGEAVGDRERARDADHDQERGYRLGGVAPLDARDDRHHHAPDDDEGWRGDRMDHGAHVVVAGGDWIIPFYQLQETLIPTFRPLGYQMPLLIANPKGSVLSKTLATNNVKSTGEPNSLFDL
jgi:hypothetical protein